MKGKKEGKEMESTGKKSERKWREEGKEMESRGRKSERKLN